MKKLLIALLLSMSSLASAEVTTQGGKFWFNGVRQEHVIGRSCFKLANIVTYHFTGQGGGKYSLGYARRWVDYNQALGFDGCRVFLETAGWSPCDTEDGTPNNCMFGSEPRDQGFWNNPGWDVSEEQSNRYPLRDGNRETQVHGVGKSVLEWFYIVSQDTGFMFELVIDATLKHDRIPKGEIDHIIRQVAVLMGELQTRYPRALVIPNFRNEWNARNQSGHSLAEVNMWALRADRDGYFPGWDAPFIVDPGGGNEFTYEVGPEPGRYNAGAIHPARDGGWEQFPNAQQLSRLRSDARGMPIASTESMYYVEAEDRQRAQAWYRSGGWTSDWNMYRQHIERICSTFDYCVVHDEKGVQCDQNWPRLRTRVEDWIIEKRGGTPPGPPDPPAPTQIYYDHLIEYGFMLVLQRPAGRAGVDVYNVWFRECYANPARQCIPIFLDVLARSTEYKTKFTR